MLLHQLKEFIGELHKSFDSLTPQERLFVFDLHNKIQMLRAGHSFEEVDDDLKDWISLGMFLRIGSSALWER